MNSCRSSDDYYEALGNIVIHYFDELTKIGAVTGTEYRVFDWLLKSIFPRVARDDTRSARKLVARFMPGNQLLVSWNGAGPGKRRLIIVAHTDHEGFLVRDELPHDHQARRSGRVWVADDDEGHPTVWLRAEDPGGGGIETWHKNANVRVVLGQSRDDARLSGRVVEIVDAAPGERPYVKVRISLGPGDEPYEVRDRIANHPWPVSVSSVFESDPIFPAPDGRKSSEPLSAPFVDNCAGVAVATAVLRALIDRDVAANVSVLYTTGEEAGFLGLLTMLKGLDCAASHEYENAIWIVVDASSHEGSSRTGLDDWRAQRIIAKDDTVLTSDRCPMDVTAIRLEDRCTIFDYSVALFLYQASLRVKSRLDRSPFRDSWRWYKNIGVAGAFVHGECEATVLARYGSVRKQIAGCSNPQSLKVGSLAIPVMNYRNYAGFGSHTIQPEVTRVGALTSAGFVLFEACSIVGDTYFVDSLPARERDCNALRPFVELHFPDRFAELMSDALDRFRGYLKTGEHLKLLEHLGKWVTSEGITLLESRRPGLQTIADGTNASASSPRPPLISQSDGYYIARSESCPSLFSLTTSAARRSLQGALRFPVFPEGYETSGQRCRTSSTRKIEASGAPSAFLEDPLHTAERIDKSKGAEPKSPRCRGKLVARGRNAG
jgi:hypothetical protein